MYLYRVTGGGGDTALRRGQAATETVRKRVGIRKAEQAEPSGFCLGDVNRGVLDIAERIDVSPENFERDRDRPHQWSSLDESCGGRYHRSSRPARRWLSSFVGSPHSSTEGEPTPVVSLTDHDRERCRRTGQCVAECLII
jgi:hypothetical protein